MPLDNKLDDKLIVVGEQAAQQGWVTLALRCEPQAPAQAAYHAAFGVYRDAYPALKPLMHRIRANA